MDFTSNRAPAVIGASLQVKAIDETAKIVMEDYGMTDMRTDVRQGETAAPKLAPRLQEQADNFFMGGRRSHPQLPRQNMSRHIAAATRGAFKQPNGYAPVQTLHTMDASLRETVRPKVNIVAGENPPRR